MKDISVIIVNYNVQHFLEQTILSVQRAVGDLDVEIIVVDNNSKDNSCEIIKRDYPDVKLIENKDNTGFSRANNQGIKISKGKYVLLLNPDTVIAEDTLQKCFDFMEKTPDSGAIGVRMVDGSGTFLPESKRGLPTPKTSFYKIFGFSYLFPKSKKFGAYHLKYLDEFDTNEVDILAGAFMFMRMETLDKSGLLDEDFFMYGEDIDLSYRITKSGYKNYYFPETTIIHYKGESTKKDSTNYVRVFYQAMLIFAEKHFGLKSKKLLGYLIYLAVFLRALISISKRFIIKTAPALFEFIIIYLSYFSVTRYWEEYNKWVVGGAYEIEYFKYHLTSYSLIIVAGLFLAGAYHKYFSANGLWRGIFISSLVLVLVYAFLPETMRYSRAILLLGAFIAFSSIAIYRSILNFIKYKSFSLGRIKGERILVVGDEDSVDRAETILSKKISNVEILKRSFNPKKDFVNDIISDIDFYRINQVVFCTEEVTNKNAIDISAKLFQKDVEMKILPPKSNFIIGSIDKNKTGEVYSLEKEFKINTTKSILNKRAFDVVSSIVLLPFIILGSIKNHNLLYAWIQVLAGKKTWIGYNKIEGNSGVPEIKSGFFQLKDSLPDSNKFEIDSLNNMNLYYSYNYDWKLDLDFLGKSLYILLFRN